MPDGMASRGRVLVTGASGCIGSALVRRLARAGTPVTVLVRSAQGLQQVLGAAAERVRVVEGDLRDKSTLAEAVRGIEVVLHAAARVHYVPRSRSAEQEFWEVNLAATEALLNACENLPEFRSFVFFSTVGVYGTPAGTVTETSPCSPETVYAQTKHEGETRVLAFRSASGAQAVVLRVSMVYGEGDRGNLQRMISSIERGRFLHIGGGLTRKSATYVENVVDAALLAASHPGAQGEVLLVSDPEPYTLREIANVIARHLGVRPPRLSLPALPMIAAGHCFGLMRKLTRISPPFTARDVRTLTTDLVCDTSKIQKLGFRAGVLLEEGIALTVRAHRGMKSQAVAKRAG